MVFLLEFKCLSVLVDMEEFVYLHAHPHHLSRLLLHLERSRARR